MVVLHIDGQCYDISTFWKKHPGGNVICFYDNLDATNAFYTFHAHSKTAKAWLKSLPKKTESLQNKDQEFTQLLDSWKAKGLYKSNYYEFLLWGTIVTFITYLGFIIQMYQYPILGGIITGLGWAQCGFVQHHAGHLGFTGNPNIDHRIQDFFEGFLKGGSASWWRNRHNKHHAMPNSIGYDGDLRTTPFFAWDDVLVKKVPTFLLRIQHIMVFPMLILYVPLFIVTTKQFMIRKRKYGELALVFAHFYHFSKYCNHINDFILFYVIGYAIQGLYLGLMFSINHMAMPRIENIGDNWFDRQIISTCNWDSSNKVSMYLSGFLNLQIEHHVAPQMPPEHYRYIRKDIMEFAKKRKLPYYDFTFLQGLCLFVSTLKDTAKKELALRASLTRGSSRTH